MKKSAAVAGLRIFAVVHGGVSSALLEKHSKVLFRATLFHFGGVRGARRAAGLEDPPPVRKWSAARVLEELRAIDRAGKSTRVRDLVASGRWDLVSAAQTYVGTIVRARKLAGIAAPSHRRDRARETKWSAKRVLALIVARHDAGRSLASTRVPPTLESAGTRYFGSWREAVTAAGIDYDAVRLIRRAYTKPDIVHLLQRLARERPETRRTDLDRLPASCAMVRLFGSIRNALRAAGLRGWPARVQRTWNRKRVLAMLREHTGGRLRAYEVAAANRYFGGVRAARRAGKIPAPSRSKWSQPRCSRSCGGVLLAENGRATR